MSAVAACHVYIYPTESFKYNIAEKNMVKPPDAEQVSTFFLLYTLSDPKQCQQTVYSSEECHIFTSLLIDVISSSQFHHK